VHGRDFKPGAEDFRDLFVQALSVGVERDYSEYLDEFNALPKQIAYYGDITSEFLTSKGIRYDEALDMGDRRNALIKLRGYERRKDFGVSRYDRLPGKTALGEFFADVFVPILGSLGFSKKLIEKVGIDLSEYWNPDSDFASRMRARVREAICRVLDTGDQVLLLSHGTGCIVTYDVLWQLSHDDRFSDKYQAKKVDVWVTMGAPLGDSMVFRRLMGHDRKGLDRYPSNVVSWHNLSAEDDFVSHDNKIADDFKYMLKQRQLSFLRDYRIYNLAVRYGKSNPHSSLGYLVHPRTTKILVEWLQQASPEATP
jgi:hypothetical protein